MNRPQATASGRRRVRAATATFAALLMAGAARAPAAEIDIGWTAWSDAEFVTRLAARVLENELGYDVQLTLVDVALQYQGVARGDLDMMLMAWLPNTHADYYAKFGPDLVDLGPIYTGAKLGWVVPTYIPESEVSSIADLARPEIARRFGYEIIGIDPGAGLTRLSEQAIKTYGLDRYHLIVSSGAAMTAMIRRAEIGKKWIVATGWHPHWMFQTWSLRFLDDPKGALGGPEHVDALVRRGLDQDHPNVVAFLQRFHLELDELETAMGRAQETSYQAAVDEFIAAHPKRVHYWATGE